MQSTLFFWIFCIFIFSLTFSSNNYNKKRKRKTEVNLQVENTYENYFEVIYDDPVIQSENNLEKESNTLFADLSKPQNIQIYVPILGASNLEQESNTLFSDSLKLQNIYKIYIIPPADLLNTLLKIPNVFPFIFAYLSCDDLEINFKFISTTFYDLYEKFLQEEKILLKMKLKNITTFLENINCTRVYFDFFEKRQWSNPSRIEYVKVNYFSEDLPVILFPKFKNIRQIIWFTFEEIEFKYVLFQNGQLSILKKLNKKGTFLSTSLEKDFENFGFNDKKKFFTIHFFAENVRWIEIQHNKFAEEYCVSLHKSDNFVQNIWHLCDDEKLIISDPLSDKPNQKLILKNISGFLQLLSDDSVTLCRFEKQKNNGVYRERVIYEFKTNVKEILSNDFQHFAQEVPFIFKTN